MSNSKDKPKRLFALARQAKQLGQPEAEKSPLGFATRVAARWKAAGPQRSPVDFLERCCWWGASVSVALCLLTFGLRPASAEPRGFDWLLQVPAQPQNLFEQ